MSKIVDLDPEKMGTGNKYAILTCLVDGFVYKIEEDLPEVGWYIYRYDSEGNLTHDYLQDTKEIAIEFSEKKFGVHKNSWEYT